MQADRDEIRGLLKEFAGKPFIILHPVATDIRRMWPIENYPKLADALFEQGFDIVFSGSQEDGGVVGEIIRLMKHPAYNTCALVGLSGLTALLSEAALMISTDTGPLHLARAVNTPTVGIYWAPNLINWGPLSRNIHKPVVSWNMTCPYCGIIPNDPYPFEPHLSSCKHEVSFVRDVTVEAVIEAVTSLLNETRNNKEIDKEDTQKQVYKL
jgi:ADP-heptose:LPS heptosyltransferase